MTDAAVIPQFQWLAATTPSHGNFYNNNDDGLLLVNAWGRDDIQKHQNPTGAAIFLASALRRQWPATDHHVLYNHVSMDACNTDLAYISQMTLGP